MNPSTQFSLVVFAPLLIGMLVPTGFLLPSTALTTLDKPCQTD